MNLLKLACVFLVVVTSSPFAVANHHEKGESSLAKALMNDHRSKDDQERDANRKPAAVLDYLGVGEGMTVMDLIAAGGYYTEVLSLAVGKSGRVYAQNPPRVLQFRDGANEKAISSRLEGDRLPNVTRVNTDINEMELPAASLDAVLTALNFHDIYNGSGKEAALGTSQIVFSLLKPGGVFGVIDHAGNNGEDNAAMHRIEVDLVKQVLIEAGFKIEGESNLLANPADKHVKGVFDPSVRGNTDRFLIRARKP